MLIIRFNCCLGPGPRDWLVGNDGMGEIRGKVKMGERQVARERTRKRLLEGVKWRLAVTHPK